MPGRSIRLSQHLTRLSHGANHRKVTISVKQGIHAARFEDGEWMERLDVIFANCYLDAFDRYRRGEQPTRSWAYTFKMADKPHVLILQHLLLGMNAHINLDRGTAAAQVAASEGLAALRRNFEEINTLLAEKVDEVQDQLSKCSPLMPLLVHPSCTMGRRVDLELFSAKSAAARVVAGESIGVPYWGGVRAAGEAL